MQKQSPTWRSPEQAQTPYQKAQQEWDRRMGAATIQAANWRFIAFGLAGLLFFSTAGTIYLGAQPKAIPHFVEIDKLGQPSYLGPLDRSALRDFTPSAASLRYHLTRFVTDTREISSDAAILKRNWLDAYKLVTPDAANELNAYVKEHNPFDERERQLRVSIQVNAIVPISKETWQVDWTETAWDEHGNQTGTTVWRGTFHILLRVPDTAEKLEVNPLGLFIDELHWTRLSTIADGRTRRPSMRSSRPSGGSSGSSSRAPGAPAPPPSASHPSKHDPAAHPAALAYFGSARGRPGCSGPALAIQTARKRSQLQLCPDLTGRAERVDVSGGR